MDDIDHIRTAAARLYHSLSELPEDQQVALSFLGDTGLVVVIAKGRAADVVAQRLTRDGVTDVRKVHVSKDTNHEEN